MVSKSNQSIERDANLVLFGLPENHSLIESKEIVDEVLDFLAGKLEICFVLVKSIVLPPLHLKLVLGQSLSNYL